MSELHLYCRLCVLRLSFAKLSLSDTGVYVCVAVNRAGNVSSSITLTVSGWFTYLLVYYFIIYSVRDTENYKHECCYFLGFYAV